MTLPGANLIRNRRHARDDTRPGRGATSRTSERREYAADQFRGASPDRASAFRLVTAVALNETRQKAETQELLGSLRLLGRTDASQARETTATA